HLVAVHAGRPHVVAPRTPAPGPRRDHSGGARRTWPNTRDQRPEGRSGAATAAHRPLRRPPAARSRRAPGNGALATFRRQLAALRPRWPDALLRQRPRPPPVGTGHRSGVATLVRSVLQAPRLVQCIRP